MSDIYHKFSPKKNTVVVCIEMNAIALQMTNCLQYARYLPQVFYTSEKAIIVTIRYSLRYICSMEITDRGDRDLEKAADTVTAIAGLIYRAY